MVRMMSLAIFAAIAFSQPLAVSSAFGDQVKLYEEQGHDGRLTFTLENQMAYPITFYAIETVAHSSPGPPVKCSIREGSYVTTGSKLVIANKCALALGI